MTTAADIAFVRLTAIPTWEIVEHMCTPRATDHMPLATGMWDEQVCRTFVQAKEEYWRRDGLGHWGILCDGRYVGWGGFQREGDEWDFGLVLKPECFGLGLCITRKALAFAKTDGRIPFVTFLLAPSRRHLRALERLEAQRVGTVNHAGHTFIKFRLETG